MMTSDYDIVKIQQPQLSKPCRPARSFEDGAGCLKEAHQARRRYRRYFLRFTENTALHRDVFGQWQDE